MSSSSEALSGVPKRDSGHTYRLFKDDVINSDCTASNDKLEWIQQEAAVA